MKDLFKDNQSLAFDPEDYGFVHLAGHKPASRHPFEARYYEYRNHPNVDGSENYLRCNLYLSVSSFSTECWYGVLDLERAEKILATKGMRPEHNSLFSECQFRGSIRSKAQAEHILDALNLFAWMPLEFEEAEH